jgi:FAD/FMN-containing dehydrogenase
MTPSDHGNPLSRRRFLGASAVLWLPVGVVTPSDAAGDAPPDFPAGIELYRRVYENWAGEIRTDELWTCAPRTQQDVVTIANWAHGHGFTVRARGHAHGWAPLTVTPGVTGADRVLLADTTRHLTGTVLLPDAVRVETGASMEALLTFLEDAGLGVTNTPAPGDLSVGGVLAIGGHGTSVPAAGETRTPGHTYGSLSNLIVSLTAVVWERGEYRLRTFRRDEPECAVLLAHVGRAFLTEVTLRVGANHHLRCVSRVDIPTRELFAAPGSGATDTLESFLDEAGRVEAIWFVFTDKPWLKVWSDAPVRPLTSRPALTPFNYVFSDNVPEVVSDLAERLLAGEWALTPLFGEVQYTAAAAGLTATLTTDLWGPSKNLMLYVKPTTLRETANGYAVLTARTSVQRVVHEFATFFSALLEDYRSRGLFPVTGQIEIRVSGLDDPEHVGVPGAVTPALSVVRPRADHPEWDVAVWFDVLTFPTAPGAVEFYRELEQFFFANYTGNYAATRAEWSKGWAYSTEAAWADRTVLTRTVPDTYRQGPDPTWDAALAALDAHDPHRVFSNAFLDVLLP